jgi:hypothetical protein
MMRKDAWTESEDHIIRTHYARDPFAAQTALPHRTPAGIRKRASQLGATRGKTRRDVVQWTPERRERLKIAYESGGVYAARDAFPGYSQKVLQAAACRFGYPAPPRSAGPKRQPSLETTRRFAVRGNNADSSGFWFAFGAQLLSGRRAA